MKRVRSILVVGGGSSGWMTAAYLSGLLTDVAVTLIESPRTPAIGVGEATVPFINAFLARMGYGDHKSWMPECDATFKTGILFEDWREKGHSYWHPFEYLDYLDTRHHTGHCWWQMHRNGHPDFRDRASFWHSYYPSTVLNVERNLAPCAGEFAFHLDAQRFGEMLRRRASAVEHVVDDVVDVRLDESGAVDGVLTARRGELRAELFVDCSGFSRLLIGRLQPAPRFRSYSSSLLCDRAVVLRIPYGKDEEPERAVHPYVRAKALGAGWMWTIPLYSRLSVGYVYSSSFISDGEAEEELRATWGRERTADSEALKIRFHTGKLEQLWVENVVAVGLAGGFIEPLESTGLAVTQLGIEMLCSMLDARFFDRGTVKRYNGHLDKFYADILQFIVAHYCLTGRQDSPFWKTVRREAIVPDQLAARLDVFRRHLPSAVTKGTSEVWMFRDISWWSVLLGMGFDFEVPSMPPTLLEEALRVRERKRALIAERLRKPTPNHYRYLRDKVHRRSTSGR